MLTVTFKIGISYIFFFSQRIQPEKRIQPVYTVYHIRKLGGGHNVEIRPRSHA